LFFQWACEKLTRMDLTAWVSDPNDPLSQPTRARIFEHLCYLRRPATVTELAQTLGLHPNGVRLHLDRMVRAGLLKRDHLARGHGRPPYRWSVAEDALPAGRPPTAYRELAQWLVQLVSADSHGVERVHQTGREIGKTLAPNDPDGLAPNQTLGAVFSAMGFRPTQTNDPSAGCVTFCLCNCPYREAVHKNQTLVCELHKGITEGLVEALAPDAELAEFVAKDPETAGCLVEIASKTPDSGL
jgi:predicted ArsR family transcriptional regulator